MTILKICALPPPPPKKVVHSLTPSIIMTSIGSLSNHNVDKGKNISSKVNLCCFSFNLSIVGKVFWSCMISKGLHQSALGKQNEILQAHKCLDH